MSRRPLIVVSNRGPVSYDRDAEGARIARRGGGGLVTALRGLLERHDVTWIASAISDEDRAVAREAGGTVDETTRTGAPYRALLVAHDPAAYDAYYNVVANPMLWFVHHSLWGLAEQLETGRGLRDAWRDGYEPVNEAFAAAALSELDRRPAAAVFFHDYHLYRAPRLVRDARPDATLAHFVHIPWPGPDEWTALPPNLRLAVFDGLLANDLVGFHTARWQRNFLRSAVDLAGAEQVDDRTLAYRGRRVRVVARAISIDPGEFDALAASDAVLERERELEATRDELLVLRVDRTDPSKNVVRGLRAFGLLLELHPELHGRVSMLALLDPSRQDVPEYVAYLAAIEREARTVNERFGRDGWTPLRLDVADDFPRSVAAYKQYDALLVNAVFDGMNLVAKEAPLVNVRDGVLVLSENAGAHEELGDWAVTVNPFDLLDQAEALHRALTMPAGERRERIEAIRAHVRNHDVSAWIDGLLVDLDGIAKGDNR
ncbi:MAG TPA: trehalose-6-phosphate synthase [Gaiellaceae bacterium]|nr:trehalose-6-phosphate synthase [Gaiellaceae bacterium]